MGTSSTNKGPVADAKVPIIPGVYPVKDLMQRIEETKESKTPSPPMSMKSSPLAVKSAWYEMDYLVKYRDPLLAVGFGLVVVGIFRIYVPAGFVVLGLGLMAASLFLSK